MRPLTYAYHRKFVEIEGWTKKGTASSGKKTGDHFRYTLTLSTGDVLFTRISHGSGQINDAKLIREIFRNQLAVSEEDFYRCVEKGILPPRPQAAPEVSLEGLDAMLVRNLIRKVGLSQRQVAKMSKKEAVKAWNNYLSEGGDVMLSKPENPMMQFAGMFTGLYEGFDLEEERKSWERGPN